MSRSPVRRVLSRLPAADCRRSDLSVAAYCTAFGAEPPED